ncbi:MAG: DUF6602 domain-containing protein [Thermodesulfovibrionales bacterium]
MTKPFYQRLQNYFSQVGKVLKGEADSASIFPNATDIGSSREKIYAAVLKLHLPSSCNVNYGGFLFDRDGNESKQLDVIISNEQTVQFNFNNQDGSGKTFSCIDGCVGVVSVKSALDSTQLIDSLLNLASLPEKRPLAGRHNPLIRIHHYDDWPYKIIYASDGVSSETVLRTLNDFYSQHPEIPIHKRPNQIHVAGKFVIIRVGEGAKTRDGSQIEPNSFHCQTLFADEFGIPFAIGRMQEIATSSNHITYNFDEIWDKLPYK